MDPSEQPVAHRLFIALPLPEPVKTEIERVQTELRHALPAGCARWTKREQLHLTLRFLGDVEVSRIPHLIQAVRDVCKNVPPLPLRAERIGCFPDLRFPRVVWVWVHDAADELASLQKAIDAAVADFAGHQAEKEFTGHITIARTREIKRPQAEILAGLAHRLSGRFFGGWPADAVEIIRSELSPTGSHYTCVARVALVVER